MQAPQPFWMIMSDLNENKVVNCTIVPGGTASCTDTGATSMVFPGNLVFAGDGSKVLVANGGEPTRTSDVTSCDYANGQLTNCAYTATKFETFDMPLGIIQEGSYAYYSITNTNAASKFTPSSRLIFIPQSAYQYNASIDTHTSFESKQNKTKQPARLSNAATAADSSLPARRRSRTHMSTRTATSFLALLSRLTASSIQPYGKIPELALSFGARSAPLAP
jgi:hypothetical protein